MKIIPLIEHRIRIGRWLHENKPLSRSTWLINVVFWEEKYCLYGGKPGRISPRTGFTKRRPI